MKMLLKPLGMVLGAGIAVVLILLGYLRFKYPNVEPAPQINVESTPERIARGQYLSNHVTGCMDCHSTRDWTKFSAPILDGTEGKGGEEFNEQRPGIPGRVLAGNITPSGVGDYTDGELLRAVTTGVTKDNRALFPIMPYRAYNHMTQEDAFSIIAYLRSLPPIENKVPASRIDFPLNLIVRTLPLKSYQPPPAPPKADSVGYGGYLAEIAGCADCHTPAKEGTPIRGMEYAGGFQFQFPSGTVRSANITPDHETGIGYWTKDVFISRFKAFAGEVSRNIAIGPKDFNTPMPWTMYAGMTPEDLGAIYDYLRTVKPVKNRVVTFTPKQ
jgi:mono/diheme cytochrome c family protein